MRYHPDHNQGDSEANKKFILVKCAYELLAEQLLNTGLEVNIFLMNDSVDLARDASAPPEGYFDLGKMLKELIGKSVPVKVCGTCKVRCGIHKGEPYFEGAREAKMTELAQWIKESDKVITF